MDLRGHGPLQRTTRSTVHRHRYGRGGGVGRGLGGGLDLGVGVGRGVELGAGVCRCRCGCAGGHRGRWCGCSRSRRGSCSSRRSCYCSSWSYSSRSCWRWARRTCWTYGPAAGRGATVAVAEILSKTSIVALHSRRGARIAACRIAVDHIEPVLVLIQPQLEIGRASRIVEINRAPFDIEDPVGRSARNRGEDTAGATRESRAPAFAHRCAGHPNTGKWYSRVLPTAGKR